MASEANTEQSVEVDYVATLNGNIANKKQNLTDQFVRIRKILDEKEKCYYKGN